MRDVKLIDTKNRVSAVAKFRDDGFDGLVKRGRWFLRFGNIMRITVCQCHMCRFIAMACR